MELVSGPDVGGGYLFQLTVEPAAGGARFRMHAQEGGLDGGAGRAGNPGVAGLRPADRPCPVGGRSCWHADIEGAPDDAPRIRFAYNRLRFVLPVLVAQRRGERPVPFREGLGTVVDRIGARLEADGIPWMVGGSAAAAVAGASVVPRDIDLSCAPEGVERIAQALEEFVTIPPGNRPAAGSDRRWAGRAFVGSLTEGIAVEWGLWADGPEPSDPLGEWRESTVRAAERWPWEGRTVPCAPPEFALLKAARERTDRGPALEALLLRTGVDRALLVELLDRSGISPHLRTRLEGRLARAPDRSAPGVSVPGERS